MGLFGIISPMKNTDLDQLPDDISSLKALVSSLRNEFFESQKEVEKYKRLYALEHEKWLLAMAKRFGAKTEKGDEVWQGDLFNEAEELQAPTEEELAVVEAAQETITYTRKKPTKPRISPELPREEVLLDIPEAEKQCGHCGHEMHRMGEEISEKLQFVPATVKVLRYVRPQYSCRDCEKHHTHTEIKIASPLPSILPKSIATPVLLAHIIVAKYQYALPLYRQENLFKSYGVELSRQTMSRWLIQLEEKLLPLYELMHELLLKQPALWSDDTPLKVIESDKSKSVMWVYGCGTDGPPSLRVKTPNIVLYDYQDSRAGACPSAYLRGYRGLLQVDGYAGYHQTDAILAGCWAHARRKFKEAQAVQPKGKTGRADIALGFITKLYAVEKQIGERTAAEKYAFRQQKSVAVMEELRDWLEKTAPQITPQSALGRALTYTLNQWQKLQTYLRHGEASIDNNRAERAIKPFVIGRKNWLFSNTHSGAKASAILYSLLETAKANGLNTTAYLVNLFEQLPLLKEGDSLESLLPWEIELKPVE